MTVYSRAQLDVLLADNSVGAISPEDMRNVVDSLSVTPVAINRTTPGSQSTVDDQWVKINGATTFFDSGQGLFTMPLDNRILNVSPEGVTFICFWTLSVTFDDLGNGVEMDVALAQDGVIRDTSIVQFTGRGTSNPQTVNSISGDAFPLNSYVEPFVRTPAGVDTIQWEEVRMLMSFVQIS